MQLKRVFFKRMVVKKFIKRDGKIFGPYYYESRRNGNKVDKIYIGGENEYQEWKKKASSLKKSYYTSDKRNVFFITSVIVLIVIVLAGIFFAGSHIKLTGFAVYDSSYSGVSNESVLQAFDTPQVDLKIKEPVKLDGVAISENKNKRMDFDTSDGRIRLYFDLLNYSEFVENIAGEVNASVVPANITIITIIMMDYIFLNNNKFHRQLKLQLLLLLKER